MQRLGCILAALWAGSLCTICALVAPTLFVALDDRTLAGQLAARFFHIAAWLGLGLAVLLVATIAMRGALWPERRTLWIVAISAALPLVSEFVLGPVMASARAAGNMQRFGMYHGVASAMFLVACVGTLLVLWRFTRPAG
jgi:hypothetical protein